ncbi:MAG TPA: DUF3105 domain-containing protein [Anaerolineales bacterium]|nr:DUF3105 domain-containing protein [Anaerolineales bacterium]
MNSKSNRQKIHERHRRQKIKTNLMWGGIGVVVIAIFSIIIWQGVRPAAGKSIQIMTESSQHIPMDSDPGEYNSDPPTSGPHYAEEARAGFYDSNNYQFPAGYLVHNLEHGYVIFWYNCDLLDETGCADLKEQIKTTMDDLGGTKLIAYPWPSLDVPLVMTSWGRLQRLETFDSEQVKAFYRANLNRAPEPDAP